MAKYLFGAYEPIDTGLAPLISYGLVQTARHPDTRRRRYFLLQRGSEIADLIERNVPEAVWYSKRASLVGALCRGLSGEDLARIQYEEPEYASAPNGETIASIASRVRERLARLDRSQ